MATNSLTRVRQSAHKSASWWYVAAPVLLSGAGWYWGNGLTGDYWYLVWLAPVPILVSSFYVSPQVSFRLALAACLLGRLSWFAYLHTVTGAFWLALLLTVLLALAYARIAVYAGRQMVTRSAGYSVFVYPVLMTAFDFLVQTFSPDGTAASLAYTQANVLPIVQVASLTGTPGITFLVTVFPSLCAFCWLACRQRIKRVAPALIPVALLYGLALSYGYYRLSIPMLEQGIRAGLVVLDEPAHLLARQGTQPQVSAVLSAYGRAISPLANAGAEVVLLPETSFRLTAENRQLVMATLRRTARRYGVQLIVGLADYSQPQKRNVAVVVDPAGRITTEYTKHHLVRGFERQFTPGHQIGLFPLDTVQAGVAICKDLDFPQHIRAYGRADVAVLFVPANDFVTDDWLHARMALLRGIENGCSVVRTARQGRLTISDPFGRVLAEANSSRGKKTRLMGMVPLTRQGTLYTRGGHYFGLLTAVLAGFFFWGIAVSRKRGG